MKAGTDRQGVDVGVVGGGPAGMTAAYHAAKAGCRVLLLDRNPLPGQKILLSGGGRCNILPETIDPRTFTTDSSPNTLRRILRSWPLAEVRSFIEETLGIELIVQRRTGKVFPKSGGGEEVQRRLLAALKRVGVRLRTDVDVVEIAPSERRRIRLARGDAIVTERVILATGGLSYPQTGSDGGGLEIARRLGHAVVPTYPALVPLRGRRRRHHALSGVALPVTLTIVASGAARRFHGDFLFTHRGYSGPVVLEAGHLVARAKVTGEIPRVSVAWTLHDAAAWHERLTSPGKSLRALLRAELPDRVADLLLAETGLSDVRTSELRREDRRRLIRALTAYELPVIGTGGYHQAEVTGGGIPLGEVDPKTLRSRIVPCLSFCGEILDAFGPIGGTNFLWAFVTGKAAGEGAASKAG